VILNPSFHQHANGESSKDTNQSGLGLFVSRNIVEAHGGRICAENNANGKGATFSFIIPK
jgi:signal transduction histidine kinase